MSAPRRERASKGSIYQRGGVWWIKFRFNGKWSYEKASTDKRVAASLLADRRKNGPSPDRVRLTFAAYAETWLARRLAIGVKTVVHDTHRIRNFVVPLIGSKALDEVTRTDVRDVIEAVTARKGATTGKPLSPRTILHVYTAIRTLYADALSEGLVTVSPCTLRTRKGELPVKRDADPAWRASAVYSRDEVETLIASEIIPIDRRALYALMLLGGGCRFGEAAGRRWRDWDPDARPLGRLLVATQADQGDAVGETEVKTLGAVREVPVHPTLARILTEWRKGFAMLYGRHPEPSDWIVPHRNDVTKHRTERSFDRLKEDLERLKLRSKGRARHAMRATYISLSITDGARADVLERVTHSGIRGGAFAGYVRLPWEAVCAEVAKLRIEGRVAKVLSLPVAVGESRVSRDVSRDSRRNRAISLLKTMPGERVELSCRLRDEGF